MVEEEGKEHRSGEDIEDTVPDHLRRRGDDVATLGESPTDRVGEQHEAEVSSAAKVASTENTAAGEFGSWAVGEQHIPFRGISAYQLIRTMLINIPDVEQGGHAENEVTPLVGTLHERTNESGDNEYLTHKHRGEDVGEGETGGK